MTRGTVSSELLQKMIKLEVDAEHIYYGSYKSMLALAEQLSALKCTCRLYVWSVIDQCWVSIK